MRTHRTTELPPGMFLEHRLGATKATKEDIVELVFVGFTLFRQFGQNICLMKDGTIVFCNRFLPRASAADIDDENQEDERDAGKPLIAGFKFRKVNFLK